MDFKLGRLNLNAVAQGVGGLVFGNEHSPSSEDSYVERYLDRISNGVLAEDRRIAMSELQSLVAESQPAQLAFGAMGLPVLIGVLKEERDDVELVRGALETLVSALTPLDTSSSQKNEVQSASLNSDLLSREPDSISLLLSLLSEDDFYIRYYTLQLLTALLTNSPNRLQEAILSVPRGITRLMDMLMDREVIRNEALLLLTHVTREAEEIQKIVVFEGGFEKIFSIIKEEGGAEGGVVVQDCLELLNNLIRKVASNQILLKETIGFDPLISILKLHRGSAYNFTQQKTINLLSALDTVELLLMGGPDSDPGKEANRLSNQTVFGQRKLLDHLLMLGVESQWASISVRCSALRCIGNLVFLNPQNLNTLANKLVGEEPHVEPALSSILRIILRASTVQEFIAADHVFKCFCEKNKDGQTILASTLSFQPHVSTETNNLPFGSLLLHGLIFNETDGDLETSCRAASVLFHILKDNVQCKERIMRIGLEVPVPSLGSPEPLMHRIVKYLALATSVNYQDNDQKSTSPAGSLYVQALLLRLLIAWLFDCPGAVDCFLDAAAHLTYLVELVSNRACSIWVRGLAAIILGECVIYNKKDGEGIRDAFALVDAISQKIGLTSYFLNFDELQKSLISVPCAPLIHHKPLSRTITASAAKIETDENNGTEQKPDHPILMTVFDQQFINFIKKLDIEIRESIVEVFSHPKNKVVVLPAELEQKSGEDNADYIKRLKFFVQKQCNEMQNLLSRNATLAEDLAKTGGGTGLSDSVQKPSSGKERVHAETFHRDLQEATQRIEILKSEKAKIEAEAVMYKNVASKIESDLKSLSDAYSSLEQSNFHLDSEVRALKRGGSKQSPDIEAIRAEAREEAQKESEAELSDLLVCLGQEQSKVEKLSSKLIELGEDVDSLLEGIGDDTGLPEEEVEEEDY